MSSEDVSRPKYSCIPRRYVMIALTAIVGVMVLPVRNTLEVVRRYIDDIDISNISRSIASMEQCKELGKIISIDLPYKEIHTKKYNLNDEVMRSLPMFQIPGFIVAHFVAAIVSDKYGAKHVVGVAVVVLSVCMIFTPVLIQSSDANINVLRFVMTLEGIGEGALTPAIACLIAHWAPPGEIGALSSLSLGALYSGNIISNLVTETMIIKSEDWTLPFYVYGGLLVGVFLIWHLAAFSNPHQDPRISPAERFYLDMEMKGIVDHRNKKIPLCQILMSLDVWATAIIFSVFIWYWIFLAFYLPRYMNVVWKVNMRQSGMWAAGPFVLMIITGVGFGFLSDWVVNYHLINVATMRKVCTNVGCMGPALYMVAATHAGCHRVIGEAMCIVGMGLMGTTSAGIRLVIFDVAPNYAGFLAAFCETGGHIGTLFLPPLINKIVPNDTLEEFQRLFWMFFIIMTVANLIFVLTCKADLKSWNQPQRPRNPDTPVS